jgi:hypothetical protein
LPLATFSAFRLYRIFCSQHGAEHGGSLFDTLSCTSPKQFAPSEPLKVKEKGGFIDKATLAYYNIMNILNFRCSGVRGESWFAGEVNQCCTDMQWVMLVLLLEKAGKF